MSDVRSLCTRGPLCRTLVLRALSVLLALATLIFGGQAAQANTCSAATSQGTAPAEWQTYCWLDFTGYNDATAKSASGQAFSFTLTDGSTLTLTLKATSPNATAFTATTAPSWTGAAVGNTAFIGIPGRPIIYTAGPGSSTVTISNINITAPAGAGAATAYMFVAADAESTDNAESLSFTTNGGVWSILDQVDPISGAQFPPTTGTGTTTFTESGGGLSGNVGGYIVGSVTPTTVSGTMGAGGLQGAMFAVRFASLKLTKQIVSSRINAADQFTYTVKSTLTSATLTSGTTTGNGNGPYNSAVVSLASGLPLTLSETMAAGSVSALGSYTSRLTCRNAANVVTVDQLTTSYNYGSLNYGDSINCTFINTPPPRLTLTKALSGNRVFNTDQFTVQIKNGAAVVASATTTGTGATVSNGSTGAQSVVPATTYTLTEIAAGTTNTALYGGTMTCANAYASSVTTLPTTVGGVVTPALGDNITCTLTNTPNPSKAILGMTKAWIVISDPVNGTTSPKAIPGALIQYSITVTNSGPGTVDGGTIIIVDPLPTQVMSYVAGTPVTFTDGAVPSGLTFSYASDVKWTRAAGGNTTFTYTPVADANGFDTLVTGVRIAPGSSAPATPMAGATLTSQPSFTLTFTAKVR